LVLAVLVCLIVMVSPAWGGVNAIGDITDIRMGGNATLDDGIPPGMVMEMNDKVGPDKGRIAFFDFRGTPLVEVLKVFAQLTGYNVVPTPEVQDMHVTLYLERVTPMMALETLCKNYNLWFTREENVVRVMKVEEYAREIVLRRDEKTGVFELKYASCLALADAVASIFGERIAYEEPGEVRSYGHVGTDDLPDFDELTVNAKDVDSEDYKDKRQEGLEEVGGVGLNREDLKKLVQLSKAGNLSTEILLQYQVGQAKAVMTVFPRNNVIMVRTVDRQLLDDVSGMIRSLDTPTRQVLLECKILEVNLSDGFDSFFDMNISPGGKLYHTAYLKDSDGNDVRDNGEKVPTGDTLVEQLLGVTGIGLVNAGALTENSFKMAFMDKNIQLNMELLEKEGRLNQIGTPVMLCANNAPAKFFQGQDTPLRKGYSVTEATTNDEGTTKTPASIKTDYDEEEVGVTLQISPSINQDGTVTLKIKAEVSTVQQGGGPPFNYIVNGKAQVGQTDVVEKTELEGIVVGRDGQTLALGGLINEKVNREEKKVPVLGDIPIFGFFFKSQGSTSSKSEIIFCITPHLIMAPEDGGAVTDRFMKAKSDHPYTRGKERIVRYDESTDSLQTTVPDPRFLGF
jgi:general secretion pathway protein D